MMVNITHEHLPMVLFRKCPAGIYLTTTVGKTTFALAVILHIDRAIYPKISSSSIVWSSAIILMYVFSDGFDVIINMTIEMTAALTVVASTLNHMPKMRNNTCRNEGLPTVIKI